MKSNSLMFALLSVVVSVVILCITHWIYKWRNPKCKGKLPPGSMGFPLLGETIQFFAPYRANNISPFITKKMERYGSIFKTNLVGHRLIVSTDAGFNSFIFQQEGKLFQCCYPKSFNEIAGRENMVSAEGFLHKYLRNLVMNLVGNESMKQKLIPKVEKMVCEHLQSWCGQASIELREAVAKMEFSFGAKILLSYSESKSSKNLKQAYADFQHGLISFPLNIPGTAYWKCLQGRKKAVEIIKSILEERRATPRKRQEKDFLDLVIEEIKKNGSLMTEAIALDLLFILVFAAFETTSIALTLAVKNVCEHPKVLEELTKEHEAILRNRKNIDSGITWQEYKSMTFTHTVIHETVRLANIVPGIFRKVLKDVDIKGYTIPAGWIVMVCPPAVHMNPKQYDDPFTFNPWRWQGQELNAGSQKFMGFGGGSRLCAGAEFSKLQMAIFLHHLVTKYRWRVIKGGDIIRIPAVMFPNGFHIQILEKNIQKDATTTESRETV
ncbi:cytochrome P450 87A3-like [Populus nigra]|uniref:cytochrome P450 87A3-like n=1 Tax=Populus nigra TaxID=3691 RepID=UPI002B2742E5|nr:cytochrome P450 87A3-like [Populus nigra]